MVYSPSVRWIDDTLLVEVEEEEEEEEGELSESVLLNP